MPALEPKKSITGSKKQLKTPTLKILPKIGGTAAKPYNRSCLENISVRSKAGSKAIETQRISSLSAAPNRSITTKNATKKSV